MVPRAEWLALLLIALPLTATDAQTSGSGLFKCPDGRYIKEEYLCDGDNDCMDAARTDEQDCIPEPSDCLVHEFTCPGTSRCISLAAVCDGLRDCPDGSDEDRCGNRECDVNQYRCDNGNCVWRSFVCDGDNDCGDNSDEDEAECPTHQGCEDHQWTCINRMCIAANWRCDGAIDCSDSTDELDCDQITQSCTLGMFNCSSGGCINVNLVCEGAADCPDGSDEDDCPTGECRDYQFKCTSDEGGCIPREWQCDGYNDCGDWSDELGCDDSCPDDHFECLTGGCVAMDMRCDGQEHCQDGSDEYLCPAPPPPVTCDPNQFPCSDQLQCIAANFVCDNRTQCQDGSDEAMCTHTPGSCAKNNGGCEQECRSTTYGHFCTCRQGYQFNPANRSECLDIDECSTFGMCSQICTNSNGSYQCSCANGYSPSLQVAGGCKATGPPGYLLLANRVDIRKSSLDGRKKEILVRNLHNGIALDFHYERGYIFWTDLILDEIKRSWFNGSGITTVISSGIDGAGGLAVDWVTDKLYWTDTNKVRIEMSDLDGQNRTVLFTTNLDKPRAIVLDPQSRLMFWTDWGSPPKIERASMDGKDRQTILDKFLVWPNALTIDYPTQTLYWADAKLHVIESCFIDGSNRIPILTEGVEHPFAMTLFEDTIYWSDWEFRAVMATNKRIDRNGTVVYGNLVNPLDIHAVHPSRQPSAPNPCAVNNGGCEYLCVLSSSSLDGYACACPTGVKVADDGRGCQPLQLFLLFAKRTDIRRISLDVPEPVDVPIIGNLSGAIGLDWDSETDMVYWSDVTRDTINVANADGTDSRVLISDNLGSPAGIAIDWINRKLYWTDASTDRIEVSELDGSNRAIVVYGSLDRPRDIVVHPKAGLMFWTDWGNRPSIERSALDGSKRTTIVSANLTFPNGLALDYDNERVYWVDAGFDSMESVAFDGSDRRVVLDSVLAHPFGLALHEDFLYWTDWDTRSVQRVNKSDPSQRKTVINGIDTPNDIHVFHRTRDAVDDHPCLVNNGGCSHLCLLKPSKRNDGLDRSCLCPGGRTLMDDGMTCHDDLSAYLLFPTINNMRQISLDVPFLADTILPIRGISETASADVDIKNNDVYWTDGLQSVIYRSPLDGNGPPVPVVDSNLVAPRSIAVDWLSGNMYWLDSGMKRIEVAKLSGKNRRVLFASRLVSPSGLAIDLQSHAMFWTDIGILDQGIPAKIERASMDGDSRQAIITTNILMPRAITIDNPTGLGGRIYWTDSFNGAIYSASLYGENRRAVVAGLEFPYGLAVHGEFIFWTDVSQQTLNRADKMDGSRQKTVLEDLEGLQDIHTIRKSDLSRISSFDNPCERGQGCSELCLPNQSFRKFTCACRTGIEVESDMHTCLNLPKSYLIFSSRKAIRRISLDTEKHIDDIIADKVLNGISIDYLLTGEDEGLLYISDPSARKIFVANLNGTQRRTLISGVNTVDGIAVDWLSRNLFWVNPRQKMIEVATIDGRFRRPVIDTGLLEPRSIAVHPRSSLLFWTDWQHHRIERAKLDGSQRRTLVSTRIEWPNGITIDYDHNLVYWIDAGEDVIEVMTLNGAGRRVVVNNRHFNINHAFGITVLRNHLFWSDWTNKTIVRADLDGGNQMVVWRGTTSNAIPMGLKLISVYNKRPGELSAIEYPGPCYYDNGGCPFLCLSINDTHRRCACPASGTPYCNETVGRPPSPVSPLGPSLKMMHTPQPSDPPATATINVVITTMDSPSPPNTEDVTTTPTDNPITSNPPLVTEPSDGSSTQQPHDLNISVVVSLVVVSSFILVVLIIVFTVILICIKQYHKKQERALQSLAFSNPVNKLSSRSSAATPQPLVLNNAVQATASAASKKAKSLPPLSPLTPKNFKQEREHKNQTNLFVEEPPTVFEMPAPQRKRRNRSRSSHSTPGPDSPLKPATFTPFEITEEPSTPPPPPPPRSPKPSVSDQDSLPSPTVTKPPRIPTEEEREKARREEKEREMERTTSEADTGSPARDSGLELHDVGTDGSGGRGRLGGVRAVL